MVQRFRRNDDVFDAPFDDTLLLLNQETGCYHSLNPVAARIWELLAEPTDGAAVVDQLVAEFVVTPEECERAVTSFVGELLARGLVIDS